MAKHDLARADGLGRDAALGLQANSKVRSGAAGAGATYNLVSSAQGNGGSGGAGQLLGTLGDGADGRLEFKFRRVDLDLLRQAHCPKT